MYVSDPGAGVGGPEPGCGQQADGLHRHSPGVLYRYSLTLITKLLLNTPESSLFVQGGGVVNVRRSPFTVEFTSLETDKGMN